MIDDLERAGRGIRAIVSVLAGLVSAGASAQCEVAQFSVHQGSIEDDYGRSVAISGSMAAVGDPYFLSGAVYIYRRTVRGWVSEAQLTLPEPQPDDDFGFAVAAGDDIVVVGARDRDAAEVNQGAAYVFGKQGDGQWKLEAELTASDGDPGDRFGTSVALDGDLIVVGATRNVNGGTVTDGSAYAFRYSDGAWQQEAQFFDTEGTTSQDTFGRGVAAAGNVVIVGAPGSDDAGPEAGAAFVYRYDGARWHLEAQLVPPGQPLVEWFGFSVGLSPGATRAFVGAIYDGIGLGAVHVFRLQGGQWMYETELTAAEPSGPNPFFGASLSVGSSGLTVLIGAPADSAQGFESGAAHVFGYDEASSWKEVLKLTGSGGGSGHHFGTSVALAADLGLVGATRESAPGRVYVFAGMSGADCDGNGEPDGCDIFDGSLDDLDSDGIPDECETAGDVNGDGSVDVVDLVAVILGWGACPAPCPPGCIGDADGDCAVGVADLVMVIVGWG